MSRYFFSLIAACAAIVMFSFTISSVAANADADVTGRWNVTVDAGGQTVLVIFDLKQDGTAFTGTSKSDLGNGTVVGGKVSGDKATCTLKTELQGQAVEIVVDGKVDGKKWSGSMNVPGFGALPFTAEKAEEKAPDKPADKPADPPKTDKPSDKPDSPADPPKPKKP